MSQSPATYNLVLREGATFRQAFQWVDANQAPINITGATFSGAIAGGRDGCATTYVDVADIASVTDGPQGTFEVVLSASQTADLVGARNITSAMWDLLITLSGDTSHLLTGDVQGIEVAR